MATGAYLYEGMTTVWWRARISRPAAPTVHELRTALDLTPLIAKDGLGLRSDSVDLVIEPGISQGSTGFIICRYGVTYSARPKSGERVEVYPVLAELWRPGEIGPWSSAIDVGHQRFWVTSAPVLAATVASRRTP